MNYVYMKHIIVSMNCVIQLVAADIFKNCQFFFSCIRDILCLDANWHHIYCSPTIYTTVERLSPLREHGDLNTESSLLYTQVGPIGDVHVRQIALL